MARQSRAQHRRTAWPVQELSHAIRHLQEAEAAIARVVEKSPAPAAVAGHKTVLDARNAARSALSLFEPAHRLRDQVEAIHRCRYCHALVWTSSRVRHLYEHYLTCTEREAERHYTLPAPSAYQDDEK